MSNFCGKCGNELDEKAKLCDKCGNPVNSNNENTTVINNIYNGNLSLNQRKIHIH